MQKVDARFLATDFSPAPLPLSLSETPRSISCLFLLQRIEIMARVVAVRIGANAVCLEIHRTGVC